MWLVLGRPTDRPSIKDAILDEWPRLDRRCVTKIDTTWRSVERPGRPNELAHQGLGIHRVCKPFGIRVFTDVRRGMAVPGGVLNAAFAAAGWQWGGRWTATPDYQHFSSTGG